jgi:hypothetical protein
MPFTRFHFGRWTAAAVVVVALVIDRPLPGVSSDTLPASLTDAEFWSLSEKLSEPDGYFRSNSGSPDNLLSNENTISTVAALMAREVKPSGVYLGVGPEQNFTYIVAMRPRIAFITDIRRGNLHLHLLYKAMFEMSADRASFVARLFGRRQPAGLSVRSSAAELMRAYLVAEALDEHAFQAHLRAVVSHLTKTRTFRLGQGDIKGIEYVYRNFHQFGPEIHYTSSIGRSGGAGSYASIMMSKDRETGEERTYLATEANFAAVKSMQQRNLIVPVVGNFAGPRTLRAIGSYLRDRGAVLTAFYVSNVEDYLRRSGVWAAFCANVASMPLDAASVFIRPSGRSNSVSSIQSETRTCGRLPTKN